VTDEYQPRNECGYFVRISSLLFSYAEQQFRRIQKTAAPAIQGTVYAEEWDYFP
jgi:hypothetical protein